MRENVSSTASSSWRSWNWLCDHDPQVAGKRVSGGRDSGLERTADADDAESDLHGGYKGKEPVSAWIGVPYVFQQMVDNAMEQKRYSGLRDRIEEIMETL